jgi:hypothetical protein
MKKNKKLNTICTRQRVDMPITLEDAYDIATDHMASSIMKSRLKHIHIAMIIKGKKVLGIACNFLGSRSQGCGFDNRTIHAERAVIKKLGDHLLLDGAFMVVVRITPGTRETGYSKPCDTCMPHLQKCIREYGLKCVYYSV